MTRRNPERPPGPSYYRLPEASWTMIRDEYLSGWTAKAIGQKWRVSPTSVYRHAADGGWGKYASGQAFHDQVTAEAERAGAAAAPPHAAPQYATPQYAGPQYAAPQYAGPLFEDLDLPRLWREEDWARRRAEEAQGRESRRRRDDPFAPAPPPGYGPIPGYAPRPDRNGPDRNGPDRNGPDRNGPDRGGPGHAPPSPEPSPKPYGEADDPPPAEAAERVAAAAGRAALAGRYDEAQKLARLAESLKKIAGAPDPTTAKPASIEEEDGWNQAVEPMDQPLNCTGRTCGMTRVRTVLAARLDAISAECDIDRGEDIEDWADMAEAIGAAIDPEMAALAECLRAKGLNAVRPALQALLGVRPYEAPPPDNLLSLIPPPVPSPDVG